MENNEKEIILDKIKLDKNLDLAFLLTNIIKKKYPYLEIRSKWNEPFFCFQEKPIFYFTEKSKLDKTIFKEKTLFLGFMEGFKMYQSKLFISSSHVQVRYVNLSKLNKSRYETLIDLIGQCIEI